MFFSIQAFGRMLILHEQEKAYNAIKYFYEHTGMCEKKKLFKLLYALDFEHFAKTGRTVTGYNYQAWRMGPIPVELDREIKNRSSDLLHAFNLEDGPSGYDSLCLVGKTPFDSQYFSKREMEMLHDIADRFRDATGTEMEAWTHREGMPWQRVYEVEGRESAFIPFDYQLDYEDVGEEDKDAILDLAEERKSFIANYQ